MKGYYTIAGAVRGHEPSDFEPRVAHYAALRVCSDSALDFEQLRRELDLEPTTVARRGEKRGPRSPPSKGDLWIYTARVDESEPLERHIDALWAALEPRAKYIRALKQRARVDIYLGYSSNIDHGGITIPRRTLAPFIELDLDVQIQLVMIPSDDGD